MVEPESLATLSLSEPPLTVMGAHVKSLAVEGADLGAAFKALLWLAVGYLKSGLSEQTVVDAVTTAWNTYVVPIDWFRGRPLLQRLEPEMEKALLTALLTLIRASL